MSKKKKVTRKKSPVKKSKTPSKKVSTPKKRHRHKPSPKKIAPAKPVAVDVNSDTGNRSAVHNEIPPGPDTSTPLS